MTEAELKTELAVLGTEIEQDRRTRRRDLWWLGGAALVVVAILGFENWVAMWRAVEGTFAKAGGDEIKAKLEAANNQADVT